MLVMQSVLCVYSNGQRQTFENYNISDIYHEVLMYVFATNECSSQLLRERPHTYERVSD